MTLTLPLAEASQLLEDTVLIDTIQLLLVDEPKTVGIHVVRETAAVGNPVPGLVQTTSLNNAVESRTENVYSIKVSRATELYAGMAVEVISCLREPSLNGRKLLVDKVSENGMALLRKAVASDFTQVNQEGKGAL